MSCALFVVQEVPDEHVSISQGRPPWMGRGDNQHEAFSVTECKAATRFIPHDSVAGLKKLIGLLRESGMPVEAQDPERVQVRLRASTIEFARDGEAMNVAIDARNEAALNVLVSQTIKYLGHLAPDRIDGIRWTGLSATSGVPRTFRELRVVSKRQVFPGMPRVTFAADDLIPFETDGLNFRLLLQADASRPPARVTSDARERPRRMAARRRQVGDAGLYAPAGPGRFGRDRCRLRAARNGVCCGLGEGCRTG